MALHLLARFKAFWSYNPKAPPLLSEEIIEHAKLVNHWTTVDEPKVIDYPPSKYKIHWEIILGHDGDYFAAAVRFYGNEDAFFEEAYFKNKTLASLKEEVNTKIRSKMSDHMK